MRNWAVTLLVFVAGLIVAAGGTYVTMEKDATKGAVRIEIMEKQMTLFDQRINQQLSIFKGILNQQNTRIESDLKQQRSRLNIAEVRSARVEEAALTQTRAVESLTSVVSSLAGSQKDIAVALAGINARLEGLEKRSASLERKLEIREGNFIRVGN